MSGTYLRECLIENVGPIRFLDLSAQFNGDGTPKPLILVGQNGSGKTVLLAHVVDALTELAKKAYRDAVQGDQVGLSPYFKVTGGGNVRSGAPFGVCLLAFSGSNREFSYIDKVGAASAEEYASKMRYRFPVARPWPAQDAVKETSGKKEDIEPFFRDGSVCFFPSSRHETPHWLNTAAVLDAPVFGSDQRVTGLLGKPIVVESEGELTMRWLMDVLLDSLADIEVTEFVVPGGGIAPLYQIGVKDHINDKLLLKQSRANVEAVLRQVIQDPSATLAVNYRHRGNNRLVIRLSDGVVIPSLGHLSAGQSVLFNTFATIIRYADRGSIEKSIHLDRIEGIVLIDEIDAHMHTSLQYEVLPKLCRLFPASGHVPARLVERGTRFCRNCAACSPASSSSSPRTRRCSCSAWRPPTGPTGSNSSRCPTGGAITTERFAEFRQSFDYYRRTKTFEDGVAGIVAAQVRAGSRPLVLTEGKIDAQYIRTALDLLGRGDLLGGLDVECVGTAGAANSSGSGSGKGALDAAFPFLRDNPGFLGRPVLLLYDHDTNKKPTADGRLIVRTIPPRAAEHQDEERDREPVPERHVRRPRITEAVHSGECE